MKIVFMFCVLAVIGSSQNYRAVAHGHDNDANKLQEACEAECPEAKSDHEAHMCLRKLVKENKSKKVPESNCYAALREHEAAEKKHGHGKGKNKDSHKH